MIMKPSATKVHVLQLVISFFHLVLLLINSSSTESKKNKSIWIFTDL